MGWIVGIVIVLAGVIFSYSICKVAGDSNRVAERDHEEMKKNQCTVLSDLEKDAVNSLKKNFSYLFEVNSKENVTVTDCIYKNDYENKQAIINDGKIIGFTL